MEASNISDAWKNVLKKKDTYISISPGEFISPIANETEAISLIDYLNKRY